MVIQWARVARSARSAALPPAAAGIYPVRKLLRLVSREPAVDLADAAKDRLHDPEDRNRPAVEHDGERVVGVARREVSENARGRSIETETDDWLILFKEVQVGPRFGDLAAAHNRDSTQQLLLVLLVD